MRSNSNSGDTSGAVRYAHSNLPNVAQLVEFQAIVTGARMTLVGIDAFLIMLAAYYMIRKAIADRRKQEHIPGVENSRSSTEGRNDQGTQ
jgi:hypothetical protein